MRIAHRGGSPVVHPSAYVAPTAVLSGEVLVGPSARILHGAVLTAEGAPLRIGAHSVVMEHAVLRSSGGRATNFPLALGECCIVGPSSHLSGCVIESACFVGTRVTVFNGARVERGTILAVGSVVHVGTTVPVESYIPIHHVAAGTPMTIFGPHETDKVREYVETVNFPQYVFGVEQQESRTETMRAMAKRYAEVLGSHAHDEVRTG